MIARQPEGLRHREVGKASHYMPRILVERLNRRFYEEAIQASLVIFGIPWALPKAAMSEPFGLAFLERLFAIDLSFQS